MRRVPFLDDATSLLGCALAIRDTAGNAATPTARCRNRRRGSFSMMPSQLRSRRLAAPYTRRESLVTCPPSLELPHAGPAARPERRGAVPLLRRQAEAR